MTSKTAKISRKLVVTEIQSARHVTFSPCAPSSCNHSSVCVRYDSIRFCFVTQTLHPNRYHYPIGCSCETHLKTKTTRLFILNLNKCSKLGMQLYTYGEKYGNAFFYDATHMVANHPYPRSVCKCSVSRLFYASHTNPYKSTAHSISNR